MIPGKAVFNAFLELGDWIRANADPDQQPVGRGGNSPELDNLLEKAYQANAWFTPGEVHHALGHWGALLQEESLRQWLLPYANPASGPAAIGLVTAGNVPLVGFHDFLSVLITGNTARVRCASGDQHLLPFLAGKLIEFQPALAERIVFVNDRLDGFDAVIATGSNNTSRYFEYYFGNWPHIIRRNRNSAAILTGDESPEDLNGLAHDVFRYFGMGCRSVSKLFVPEGYDFDPLFKAFYGHRNRVDHARYANNYDYNKAVFLMSGADMLDNGFLLLKNDQGYASPIGTLFYENYPDLSDLLHRVAADSDAIQCLVGPKSIPGSTPFGRTQVPELGAYADGVDTIEFLLTLSVDESAG